MAKTRKGRVENEKKGDEEQGRSSDRTGQLDNHPVDWRRD